ncbi:MAG: AAA family ATPase, partial [Planctomycetota bacterium]
LLSSARLWETEGYGIKDLIDEQNRARLEKAIERSGARVIVLDNLSTLSSGDENSSEEWAPVESWLVKLRAQGLTVILVHHAGKGGQQRGTSRREGPMDLIIKLQRAKNYEATDGCRAEVLFEKCRDAYGTGVETREIQLIDRAGGRWFSHMPSREAELERMIEMNENGNSLREIGAALEPPKSHTAVRKALKKAGIDCSRGTT